MVKGKLGGEFLAVLTRFLELTFNGYLPQEFYTCLASAQLSPLAKDTTPNPDVRPIALTETLSKVIGKIVMTTGRETINDIFHSFQLGIAISCGTELITKSIEHLRTEHPEYDILALDASNAFNTASRAEGLNVCASKLPWVAPFLQRMYLNPTPLFVTKPGPAPTTEMILSTEGARQGDTLGPLFYCLSTLKFLEKLRTCTVAGGLLSFIDDINVGGPPESLKAALEVVISDGPSYGYNINRRKTKILQGPANQDITPYEGIIPTENIIGESVPEDQRGVKILGVPIGTASYVQTFLNEKLASLKEEAELLHKLKDAHGEWVFLYYIIRNKITFLQRQIHPSQMTEFTAAVKELLRNCLTRLIGVQIDDRALYQASLPLKDGGCALSATFLNDIGTSAYVASCAGAANFMLKAKLITPEANWYKTQLIDTYYTLPDAAPGSFEEWMKLIAKDSIPKLQHLLATRYKDIHVQTYKDMIYNNDALKAHYGHVAHDMSGLFLMAIPKSDHLSFSPTSFIKAMQHRLHLTIYDADRPLQCSCQTTKGTKRVVDTYGHHLMSCPLGTERQQRHNHLVRDIAALARQAGMYVKEEPQQAYAEHYKNLRPDLIIYQSRTHNGNTVCMDVTVIKATDKESAKEAVERASKNKTNKYAEATQTSRTVFEPMAIEVHGAVTHRFRDLIKEMVELVSERCGDSCPVSVLKHYWFTRLSVSLAKENGNMLFNRLDKALSWHHKIPPAADLSIQFANAMSHITSRTQV